MQARLAATVVKQRTVHSVERVVSTRHANSALANTRSALNHGWGAQRSTRAHAATDTAATTTTKGAISACCVAVAAGRTSQSDVTHSVLADEAAIPTRSIHQTRRGARADRI